MTPTFLATYDGQWRLVRLDGQDVAIRDLGGSPGEASLVRQALRDWASPTAGVYLALTSDMVIAARISTDGLSGNYRRSGMLCLLEEQLPLDIESMTADFLPPLGNGILGVAVETARVRALLDPLEAAGIEVVAICPLALLALWQVCHEKPGPDYALIRSGDTVDVFRLREGQPVAWYTLADGQREILECLRADGLVDPVDAATLSGCFVGQADWPGQELTRELEFVTVQRQEAPVLHLAAQSAAEALRGGAAGWVNLRREALAMTNPWAPFRGLLRGTLALTVVLVLALTTGLCWRGLQYRDAAQEASGQQQADYRTSHPGRPIPSALTSHLRSELARLSAVSGQSKQMPPQVNAMETLRRMVGGLDPAVRLRLLDVQLTPENLLIHGQARSYGDAEAVNRALTGAGFAMDPPRAERTSDGGVTFTLAGRFGAASTPGKPGTRPAAGAAADPGRTSP